MHPYAVAAQLLIALSVAFVWVVRTDGVVREFHEYGIPDRVRNAVGASKIALATLLVVGIWFPAPVVAAALTMAFLMGCAALAHARVRHPWRNSVPSLGLCGLSLGVAAAGRVARS